MLDDEQWKDYMYDYQVSNYGRLKNKKNNKILKPNINKKGYVTYLLSLGSKKNYKRIRIHRAVAELFIPNPNNYPIVNHLDGNKTNNIYLNLEWCTYSRNRIHAIEHKLVVYKKGCENKKSKLNKKQVEYILENYIPGDKDFGSRALGRKFNIDHTTILDIVNKKSYN